jgi:RNA polymerase sigma-70 factor (ECF subfamily)
LGAVSTWLFTIARRLAVNYKHERYPIVNSEDASELIAPQSVHEVVAQQIDFGRLEELLAALPRRERELIALKYGAEMTNRMIAELTGLSESNVGTILHRVVKSLRTAWER